MNGSSLRFASLLLAVLFVAALPAAPRGGVAAQNERRFLYVFDHGETSNALWGFDVTATGALLPLPWRSRATGGAGGATPFLGGTYVAADSSGRLLFASNGESETVSVFRVNLATGELTPAPGSPFPTGADASIGIPLAVTPDDRFLLANSPEGSAVSVFAVGADGRLAHAPGSPHRYATEATFSVDMAVSPDGRFVALALLDPGAVAVLAIGDDGRLAPAPGSPFALDDFGVPLNLEFDRRGRRLYATVPSASEPLAIRIFDVADDGRLATSPESPFVLPDGVGAESLRLSPDGSLLFVSDSQGLSAVALRVAADGGLSVASRAPFGPDVDWANDVATDRDGALLFAPHVGGGVSVFEVGGGQLSTVPGSPFPLKSEGALLSAVVVPPPSFRVPGCAPDVTAEASLLEGGEIGARVDFEPPSHDGCDVVSAACTPEPGSFFPLGTTAVSCVVSDECGETVECGFSVTVEAPQAVCGRDVTTGDTFVQVLDPASPIYGAWRYRTADGEVFSGVATKVKYSPTGKYKSNQKSGGVRMKAKGKPATGTLTVRLTRPGAPARTLFATAAFDGSACP